jgi:glutamate/aspartate transport system permease protein
MTIGVMEITHTAYYIDSFTWHGLETTTTASLLHLTIGLVVVTLMGRVEKRIKIPGMITRGN